MLNSVGNSNTDRFCFNSNKYKNSFACPKRKKIISTGFSIPGTVKKHRSASVIPGR